MPHIRLLDMTRVLGVLALAGSLVACDSFGSGATDYDGIIEISLVSVGLTDATVRLVAVEDTGCRRPLITDLDRDGLTRTIRVEGIQVPEGAECEALIPAEAVIEFETGADLLLNITLEIRHAGETDLYGLSGGAEPRLTPIRTSTTRLAD